MRGSRLSLQGMRQSEFLMGRGGWHERRGAVETKQGIAGPSAGQRAKTHSGFDSLTLCFLPSLRLAFHPIPETPG